jgi:hypothetical protein
LVRLVVVVFFLLLCLPAGAWADDQPPPIPPVVVGPGPPETLPPQAPPRSLSLSLAELPSSLLVGVSYDYDLGLPAGFDLCFLRRGARACIKPAADGWVMLAIRKGDGSGSFQYFTLRRHGVAYARSIVRLD